MHFITNTHLHDTLFVFKCVKTVHCTSTIFKLSLSLVLRRVVRWVNVRPPLSERRAVDALTE